MQRLLSLLVIWAIVFGSTPALSLTVNGQLKGAILEKSSSDLSNWEGRVYWNTTDKQAKVYNGTDWTTLGSGSGGDGLDNQIENARAEEPVVPTSFKVYDDGAVDAPVDCTGGTPTAIQAWTRSTSSPIQGDASWLLQKDDAEDAQGQGWAIEFTVPADHPMASSYYAAFNFDFKFSDSDGPGVRIYVYDVTNSTMITPSFVSGGGGDTPTLTPVTSSTSRAQLGFQTTNGTSYRICVHNADTDTDGYSLKVDGLLATTEGGVQVGSQIGEWENFTPGLAATGGGLSLGGATSSQFGRYRRTGDSAEVQIAIAFGASTPSGGSGSIYITDLPFTPDFSKIAGSSGVLNPRLYSGQVTHSGTGYDASVVFDIANERIGLLVGSSDLSSANPSSYGSTSGDRFQATFTVPVSTWAGGTAVGENKTAYYYSTGNTWGTTNSSASTSQGQRGVLGGASTPGSAYFYYTFAPASPIQPGAKPQLEVSNDGQHWFEPGIFNGSGFSSPPSTMIERLRYDGTNYIGAHAAVDNNGKIVVTFGKYAAGSTSAWSGTWYWRVKVESPGVPVPFGLATSERPGLISGESSSTTTLTCSSGCASGTGSVVLYKTGKVVNACFAFNFTKNGSSGSITLGTLPSEYRPAVEVWAITSFAVSSIFGTRLYRGYPDGTAILFADSALSGFSASATISTNSGTAYNCISWVTP